MKFSHGKLFHALKSQNWYVESLKNYFKTFTNTCVFLVFQIINSFCITILSEIVRGGKVYFAVLGKNYLLEHFIVLR